MSNTDYLDINLTLFGEGGDGGDGGAEGSAEGVQALPMPKTKGVKNPLADVKYGIQEDDAQIADVQTDETDRVAEFERLIKEEYKDLYDAKVRDTIQKRLKGTKDTVDKYNALTPVVEMLANKYGVDASDINALNKAIEEDDTYYEEEALEKGVSVQQLKAIKKMERENADLKRQMDEQRTRENADRIYADWMNQAQEAKRKYPSLNLQNELANPQFVNLLRSGIDVDTAYTVIHKDEIIPAAMQYTAKTVEQKLANKVRSNGARPSENGLGSSSPALTKSDVTQLTKADRQEIIRRVQAGEKIRF